MKRVVAITVLILASVLTFPLSTHPVHAVLTGVVCLTRVTSNNCPQVPLTFNATSVGKTFTIGVFINNSEAMASFDIYVKSNPSFLNPVSAALGPLIVTPTLTSICVNGSAQTGSCTTGTANGLGVVEVTTSESSGSTECGGLPPCSGMAFTITYSVAGLTSSSAISYPTAAGCVNSSVASPADVCVLVTDQVGTTQPETILGGDFTDQTPSANFGATPTIGPAPLTVSFDASTSNATVGHLFSFYNWTFGDGLKANVTTSTTTHVYTNPGTYNPTLVTEDNSGSKSSTKSGLTITVLKPDFSINANTTSLTILPGRNRNATIILTSINTFSGTVSLSANSSITLGVLSTLNKTSVNLASGKTDTSAKLTVTTTALTAPGRYVVNVTGTSGTLKHSVFITIIVTPMQYLLSNSGAITVMRGSSNMNTITAKLTAGAGQPVTLSCVASSLPAGASCLFNPAKVTPTSAGNSSILTVTTTTSTPAGPSMITVTGTPLPTTNTTFVFTVTDFQISANPQSVSIPINGNGGSVITLTSRFSFSGNVILTAKPNSSIVVAFLNRTSLAVPAQGSNSSSLYIIVLSNAAPGPYKVTVTGTIGSLSHSFDVNVTVPIPNFGASATPTSISIKSGTNATSAITLTGLNGFTGTINLHANASATLGIMTIFSSATVSITGGPGTSTLTITTTSSTATGTYAITVNASTTSIYHLVTITLTVVSPQASIQLGAASLSAVSATAGKAVVMTVTVSNTGSTPVNATITMDVNGMSGGNITVAQKTVILTPGMSTITLSWDTTQWSAGSYRVYSRIIGSQTSAVNQAQNAGTLAISSPPPTPTTVDLSIVPWITTGIAAAIAAIFGLLLIRRRRPGEPSPSSV